MTNAIDLIRNGIINGNWKDICLAYKVMTGGVLEVPDSTHDLFETEDGLRTLMSKMVGAYIALKTPIEDGEAEIVVRPRPPKLPKAPKRKGGQGTTPDEGEERPAAPPSAPLKKSKKIEIVDVEDEQEEIDEFYIEHTDSPREDGKTLAVYEEDEPHHNDFVPDPDVATEEIAESIATSKKAKPKKKRSVFKTVKAKCDRCDRTFDVHPDLAPRKIGDELNKFICDGCGRMGGRER